MYNKFEDPTIVSRLGDTYKRASVDLANTKTYTLELTSEELDFLYTRCSRKAQRLEEAGLKDIPCYRLSWQVMSKISNVKKEQEEKEYD